MRYRLLLAGILHLAALPASAGGEGPRAGGVGYAEGDRSAASQPSARQSGVVPLTRDSQVAYELGADDAALSGKVTTRLKLSKHEMFNLRLERDGGGAYWSRRYRGREQRIGLFSADFGVADRRVLGWEYADGYALADDGPALRSGSSSWSGQPLRAVALPPPEAGGRGPVTDSVGDRVRDTFLREHGRVGEDVRAEGPLPGGRRDLKLAAGGNAESGLPFVGGALRQGLTPGWTVEAGGYAEEDAAVYARSRLRLGDGLLKLETRSDEGALGTSRRAAYVFRNSALAVEHHDGGGRVGARLYGARYYAALDHGMGDGDSRLALGYSTGTRLGRVAVSCEAREGREDSRSCGVGLQVPLRWTGIRGASRGATFRQNRAFSAGELY